MQKRFYKKKYSWKPLANERIKAWRVRAIDETGKQLGIIDTRQALKIAKERNLDLVQVTEKVEPPVCKILDYGKYLYQQKKKEKPAKLKGKELKGIRLSFSISEHDLQTRINQAEKFLKKGYQVRVEMPLRGRQKSLHNFANQKIKKFLEILNQKIPIKIERELKKEARGFIMIITQSAKNSVKKNF